MPPSSGATIIIGGTDMYKLITHTDLDGAGCAVLARLAWKDGVDISYCANSQDATKLLLRLYKEKAWKKYSLVFVTDMNFDASILGECRIYKDIMRMFDHHASSVEPFAPYFKWAKIAVEEDGRPTCGTELFYRYLRRKSLIGPRDWFVEQVRLFDTWDWAKGNSSVPKYLSGVVTKIGLRYFVETYTERLRYADVNELNIFNQYERDILLYDEANERRLIDMFLKDTYICVLKDSTVGGEDGTLKVGVTFNSGLFSSLLGNTICDTLPVDIAFLVNLNRGKAEARTKRDDIDLSRIMKALYNGGGHAKAAGGEITMAESVIRDCLRPLGEVVSVERPKP